MSSRTIETQTFHRQESPTQSPEDAILMEKSGELHGGIPRDSDTPQPQAYAGPLPDGKRGIEFETTHKPTPGQKPTSIQNFRGADSGVEEFTNAKGREMGKIKIKVTKNTQTINNSSSTAANSVKSSSIDQTKTIGSNIPDVYKNR